FACDSSKVERFEKESASASRLNHPNIVRYFDFGKDGDVHYLAMELVEGKSVGDLIKGKRAVKIEEALRIIKCAAEGLAYAHEQGIVHRDIKPDNIMINKENVVQVADFGLARDLAASQSFGSGEIVGTPYYISPEQIDCLDVDGRADIYSLGATIYHLITGKRPFEGETPMEVLLKHVNEKLVPPVDLNPLVPLSVSRCMQKMLEKNREFRYQNCKELVADIEAIEAGGAPRILLEEETTPKKKAPAPVVPRPRSEALVALGWTVVIIGAVVALRFAVLPALEPGPVYSAEMTEREKAARALREASEFAAANPDAPGEALKRLAAVSAGFPGAPEARQASDKLRDLENALKKEAQAWADERARQSAALESAGRMGRALLEALAPPPDRIRGRAEVSALKPLQERLAGALAEREGMALVLGGLVPDRTRGPGKPPFRVAAFLMDLTEVSNRDYLEFVKARGVRAPWAEGRIPAGQEELPVAGVDYAEAEAYAKFRGKRLPNEVEWELAAGGEEGRPYAWGDAFDPARARFREPDVDGPLPVSSIPGGRSPLGLFHLAGNVWEWASPVEETGASPRIARGGGWASHPSLLRSSSRIPLDPSTRDPELGFRCAREP
ncbi:MAG: SUMF1/EgtB/PvdO family nonheme iron enzyme, partial [Planctomycetes bacterium]|nr:SUMF1/EgtB/PvdO family nonheme iron enzyme [Planctomycetota bacterium]